MRTIIVRGQLHGSLAAAPTGFRSYGSRALSAELRVLVAGAQLPAAGTAMLWLLPATTCTAGLPVAGLGTAVFFPVLVALTPERMGAERMGRTVGRCGSRRCG